MAEKPISLSKHRKARARDAARRKADANAVAFGRSKAEKQAAKDRATQETARLDAHRRSDDPDA